MIFNRFSGSPSRAFRRMVRVALPLALAATLATPAAAGVQIAINKTTQTMSVAVDGALRWVWPVSTGRPGYDTPSGRFTAFRMEAEHYSKEWDDAPMPHSIFFTRQGHAIHGTLEERKLGRRVSHGCVRLSRGHAARLFALVQKYGLGATKVSVFSARPHPRDTMPDQPLPLTVQQDVAPAPAYGWQPPPPNW